MNVNQVDSNASDSTACSSGNSFASSGAASSSGASPSVRVFIRFHEAPGPSKGDLDEYVEVRDPIAYVPFRAYTMLSQVLRPEK